MSSRNQLDEIIQALRDTGLPWEVKDGKKHHKIILRDRLVAVYSRTRDSSPRGAKNVIACIRRACR